MLFTAHALAGGAIGEITNNSYLALPLGICTHFVLDAIPHYDTTDSGEYTVRQIILAAGDMFIGLIVFTILFYRFNLNYNAVLLGAIGSIIPDFLSLFPPVSMQLKKLKWGESFLSFHEKIQKVKLSPVPGLLIQICVWIISIYILIITRK